MDMTTKKDRAKLKSYFEKNCKPTETQFAELIDGMLNQKDDGIVKLPNNPLRIEAVDGGNSKDILHFYQRFDDQTPDWKLHLKSNDGELGFNISEGKGDSRLFIEKDTGNIGIGTTVPKQTLEVNGIIKASKLHIEKDLNVDGNVTITGRLYINDKIFGQSFHKVNPQKTLDEHLSAAYDPSEIMIPISDKRMKQDIRPLNCGLQEIKKLSPVSFNWKDAPNQHKSFGLIAQEVELVINEVVYRDEQDTTDDPMLSIIYLHLIPVLINAIQELDIKIEGVINRDNEESITD